MAADSLCTMKVDACRRQNCLSTKMSLGVFRWSYGSMILRATEIATRYGSCDMSKKARTRNFGDVIRAKLAANPKLAEAVKEQSFNAEIAQQVYDLRKQAGLTQRQLARLVDSQQSVISRIEDADYSGHSLTMLKRIAQAL